MPNPEYTAPRALITGASGGLGQAVARELAQQKLRLALHYHRNQTVTEVAALFRFLCLEAPEVTGEEGVVDGDITRLGKRQSASAETSP